MPTMGPVWGGLGNPTLIGKGNECQQWVLKGGGLGNVTLIVDGNECQQWALKGVDWAIPHRLEKGTSASNGP